MFSVAPMSNSNPLENSQSNLGNLESTIKRHEDNLKFLATQRNKLDESILDLQVSLGKYDLRNETSATNGTGSSSTEEETMGQIMKQENTAASLFYWSRSSQSSNPELDLGFTDDILGIVAALGRVEDDNHSRILSEFLGLQTMLAIVCRTNEGVKAVEKYDEQGNISIPSSIHGVASSLGKTINGRFLVMSLEDLRQYAGEFVANDPQRKLALPKPKLPNGECPNGFLDYAVNLINLDGKNLSCVTRKAHGLRETLFYSLFGRVQVYKTRHDLLQALPCITEGALSLDGGIVRKSGILSLGSRKDVAVRFPVVSGGSDVPAEYIKSEDMIRMMKWQRLNIAGDMRREHELLDNAKARLKGQG